MPYHLKSSEAAGAFVMTSWFGLVSDVDVQRAMCIVQSLMTGIIRGAGIL